MGGQATLGSPSASLHQVKHTLPSGFWIVLFVFSLLFVLPAYTATPPTVDELLDLPTSQRTSLDPAELSLLCTRGLSGAQRVDATRCLAALEQWTEFVRVETARRLASPAPREHSTGDRLGVAGDSRRKAQTLLQGLRDVLGPDRRPASLESGTLEAAVATGRPLDPQDLFLCGVLGSADLSHRPTSVLLPWLYLAVGRRLGYPLRLAAQEGRLLLRWEGQDEQFTIDWQQSWSEPPFVAPELRFRLEQPGRPPFSPSPGQPPLTTSPLHLLTADDELAVLLDARGACLESHGQNREALVAYAQAHRLSPDCDNYLLAIAHVMPKISALFGHTQPMPAPDYSDRGGPWEEVDALNRYNLQRREEDETRSRQVMEDNRRAKARQDQHSNYP